MFLCSATLRKIYKQILLPSTAGRFQEIPRITVNIWNNYQRRKICASNSHVHVKLYDLRLLVNRPRTCYKYAVHGIRYVTYWKEAVHCDRSRGVRRCFLESVSFRNSMADCAYLANVLSPHEVCGFYFEFVWKCVARSSW